MDRTSLVTNSLAGSVVQLHCGPALLCPWARCFTEITNTHTNIFRSTHRSAQTHNLYKCDVTDQRTAALIYFSRFFLKDMSKRNVLEDWILALSKWMFSGPGEAKAHCTVWVFKNQGTDDEKLGWCSLSTMWENTGNEQWPMPSNSCCFAELFWI